MMCWQREQSTHYIHDLQWMEFSSPVFEKLYWEYFMETWVRVDKNVFVLYIFFGATWVHRVWAHTPLCVPMLPGAPPTPGPGPSPQARPAGFCLDFILNNGTAPIRHKPVLDRTDPFVTPYITLVSLSNLLIF